MTYHPIDKPTEPGWYWCIIRWEGLDRTEQHILEVVRLGSDKLLAKRHGDDGWWAIDSWRLSWYGPAIEPPATDGPTQGTVR